jgi:hypothetical protein
LVVVGGSGRREVRWGLVWVCGLAKHAEGHVVDSDGCSDQNNDKDLTKISIIRREPEIGNIP